MSAKFTVFGNNGPTVRKLFHAPVTDIHHRFYRYYDPGRKPEPGVGLTEIRNGRFFVKLAAYTMPDIIADNRIA